MPGIGKLLAALPAAQALVRRNFLAQKRALFHGEEMPEGLVTGVSIGMRERGGRRTKEPCLIFHVPYKVPAKELKSRCVHHKLPGVPTDVVVGHPPRAHDAAAPADPLLCGQSFAHWKIGRGTAGCLVSRPGSADPTTRDLFVLSANHVLAACGECAVGDKIFNPSKDDGGEEPPNVWAELKTWVELDWTGVNTVDAALAWVTESMVSSMLANGMRYVAQVQPLGQRRRVFKFGAASRYTEGVLDSNYYGGQVEYVQPRTRTAMFSHLLQVTPTDGSPRFSQPGDSGALVVDSLTGRAVGLVIAGAAQSYVCPIGPILTTLGATLFVS